MNSKVTKSYATTRSTIQQDKKEEQGKMTGKSDISITNQIAIFAFAFTFFIGVVGNLLVCYNFGYKRRHRRSTTETLMLILGIVDFFASITNPALFTYWILTKYSRWDFGVIGCKLIPPLGPFTSTLSALIIIIICIDRYRAIVTPFKGRFRLKQIAVFIAVAVIFSISSQIHYGYHLTISQKYGTCLVPEVQAYGYALPHVISTLVVDITYIVVFTVTNIRVFRTLKGGQVRQLVRRNSDSKEHHKRETTQITRVLLTVGIVFGLLVFPRDALQLAFTLSWLTPPGIPFTPWILTLNSYLKVLHVGNSCANVFIYSKMHARFRSQIRNRFLRCIGWKQKFVEHSRSRANSITTGIVSDMEEFNNTKTNGYVLNGSTKLSTLSIDIKSRYLNGSAKQSALSINTKDHCLNESVKQIASSTGTKETTTHLLPASNQKCTEQTYKSSRPRKHEHVPKKQVRVRFAASIRNTFGVESLLKPMNGLQAVLRKKSGEQDTMPTNHHGKNNEQNEREDINDCYALLCTDETEKGEGNTLLAGGTSVEDLEWNTLLIYISDTDIQETDC